MKKTLTMFILLTMIAGAAIGQTGWGWQGELGNAVDTTTAHSHGVAIDGDGKIWYAGYYSKEIYVFNPDGTAADFSPITTLTLDGVTDTLGGWNRGLSMSPDGNIVAVVNSILVFKINKLTGEAMMKLAPEKATSLTKAAFTSNGEMVLGYVLPSLGVDVYDADWAHLGEVIPAESTTGYARTIEVAKDGTAIYSTRFSSGYGFIRFASDSDIYGSFEVTGPADTIAVGLNVESVAIQPGTGYLWGGNTGGTFGTNWTHYAFDPENGFALVDSIVIPYELNAATKPRGIDFTSDGNTAYVVYFDNIDGYPIYKFVKGAVGVWEHAGTMIAGYALKANYPNPFNPSTKLDVVMKDGGVADLRIYDMRGAEVAVLNSGYLSAGEHSFTFNAANFAAGVYIAKFTANGAMYTQTMTLVK